MVNAVILLTNGDIKDIDLVLKSKQITSPSNKLINNKLILSYLEIPGKGAISLINTWKLDTDYSLQAFGYSKGKTINNHELPPSSKSDLSLYGDILMIRVNNNLQLISITSDEYETFYNILYSEIDDSSSNTDMLSDNSDGDSDMLDCDLEENELEQ